MTSQTRPRSPLHDASAQPLPFYLTTPSRSQYLPLPQVQSSLANPVSPQEYRPEKSLTYLTPVRTFQYKQYELFSDDMRLLKESSLSPGPAPFQPLSLPSGGRFLLGQESQRIRLAAPGPGSYSPTTKVRLQIPCAAVWRASPAPTATEQAANEGAETAGPGSFLGLAPLEKIGSVSWGSGVGGRFDSKELDQTGPLLGPGTYDNNDPRNFGKSGVCPIIRAEHDTAALIKQMKSKAIGGRSVKKKVGRDKAASPGETLSGSRSATRELLEKFIRETSMEIVHVTEKELERDEQERLSLSCSIGSRKLVSKKFTRMHQDRRKARENILKLMRKKERLLKALAELDKKIWSDTT